MEVVMVSDPRGWALGDVEQFVGIDNPPVWSGM